jgi:biotin carboxyl carrier protein
MIRALLRKLFGTGKNQNEIEIDENAQAKVDAFNPEKGEVISIFLPEFGDSENPKIIRWNVKIGDTVKKGDILCEIETRKFTMEFESMAHGRIMSVSPKNKILKVGDEICKISSSS